MIKACVYVTRELDSDALIAMKVNKMHAQGTYKYILGGFASFRFMNFIDGWYWSSKT